MGGMSNGQRKSIALNSSAAERVYRTFEDWRAEQLRDSRNPAERGIKIGASVMRRYMRNHIIITDRATVLKIEGDMVTLRVKDAREHTCEVNVAEIVSDSEERVVIPAFVNPPKGKPGPKPGAAKRKSEDTIV